MMCQSRFDNSESFKISLGDSFGTPPPHTHTDDKTCHTNYNYIHANAVINYKQQTKGNVLMETKKEMWQLL